MFHKQELRKFRKYLCNFLEQKISKLFDDFYDFLEEETSDLSQELQDIRQLSQDLYHFKDLSLDLRDIANFSQELNDFKDLLSRKSKIFCLMIKVSSAQELFELPDKIRKEYE